MTKIKGQLTISRPISSSGEKLISIRINDVDAGIEFLRLEIGLEEFAECLTGLSRQHCEFEVENLQNVGKRIEREPLVFAIPQCSYPNKKKVACETAKSLCNDGWHAREYFDSKDSFFTEDGIAYARTQKTRWVSK